MTQPTPDPMAMLAFLQRLMTTMSEGGDVDALMAEAPPGFAELFADAQDRVSRGDVPDLGQLLGGLGMGGMAGMGGMGMELGTDDDDTGATWADDDEEETGNGTGPAPSA